ncbi:MAG TPA: hypothetical protein VL691_03460 [Vicinamibacteria bacterium]|nr:hypothetical protein [Vicinamibacteria bacterium]
MSVMNVKRSLSILAVVAGIVSAVACGYTSPTAPNPAPGVDVQITIKGMLGAQSYDPNPASVKVGQTVAWYNADTTAHSATGAVFDTGSVGYLQTSQPITLTAAGTISYHDSLHPDMVGTLTVTQ